MRLLGTGLLLILLAQIAFAEESAAPVRITTSVLARSFKNGDVWCTVAFPPPKPDDLVRSFAREHGMTDAEVRLKKPQASCQLVDARLGKPSHYPELGELRIMQEHFDCIVTIDQKEVDHFNCDRRQLVPKEWPTSGEILRALPRNQKSRSEVRLRCELVECQLEQPRMHPHIGQARMLKSRFKCIVSSDQGQESVHIQQELLLPVK